MEYLLWNVLAMCGSHLSYYFILFKSVNHRSVKINPILLEDLCKLSTVNAIVCISQTSKMLQHILSIQRVSNFKEIPLLFVAYVLSCSVSFLWWKMLSFVLVGSWILQGWFEYGDLELLNFYNLNSIIEFKWLAGEHHDKHISVCRFLNLFLHPNSVLMLAKHPWKC